ncbi:MAG TPA: hypothetical protein PKD00_10085 [Burkholderiales bacterium]|nr:hypothetical protein [Burkholderiales bacterium]
MNISPLTKQTSINLHGVALKIYDCGILITGHSGVGKSDLALNLIDKGHKLIADDSVTITKHNNKLKLNSLKENFGFMHINGIGFINIANLYSKHNLIKNAPLNFIVELSQKITPDYSFSQKMSYENILGINISKFILTINNKRPLPLLIEVLTKNYIQLIKNGYNSNEEFIKNHQSKLL